jgi:hypothetical protein
MLDEARQLGREILTDWLKDNYGKIKRDLTGLDVSHVGFVPVVFQADLVAMP